MSDLVAVPSLREFFKQMLVEAIHHQKLELAEVTEFYLVNLLAEFAESENLFTQDEGGRKDHEPLALLYYRALQEDRERKIKTLRRLGMFRFTRRGSFPASCATNFARSWKCWRRSPLGAWFPAARAPRSRSTRCGFEAEAIGCTES